VKINQICWVFVIFYWERIIE